MRRLLQLAFILIFGILGGVIGSTVVLPWLSLTPAANILPFLQGGAERTTIINRTETKIVQEIDVLKDAISKLEKNTVAVEALDGKGKRLRQGTGIIVTTDGRIVTTAGVVKGAELIRIMLLKGVLEAKVVKTSVKENLVLLQIEQAALAPAIFVQPVELALGERIFFLSYEVRGAELIENVEAGFVKAHQGTSVLFSMPSSFPFWFEGGPVSRLSGEVVGILDLQGERTALIPIDLIEEFIR